jgi:predicted nucleic acid-binding protein
MAGKPRYYWDSWAFISWLKGEGTPREIEGLAEKVKDVEGGNADLFTSALTSNEVLKGRMTAEEKKSFKKLFQRRNVIEVDITGRVLAQSEAIREWNPKIAVPDAIHLATAILYEATEFHTNDGGGRRKRPKQLIPHSGNVAGHNLKILRPLKAQASLFDGQIENEKKSESTKTEPKSAEVQRGSSGPAEGQAGTEGTGKA